MAAIGIFVNGELREVERETNLKRLLDCLGLPERRVAIELNGQVVGRSDWPQIKVNAGDKIEVVHFVGGG